MPNTKLLILYLSVPLAVMLLLWYKMMTNAGAADLARVCLLLRTTEQDRRSLQRLHVLALFPN